MGTWSLVIEGHGICGNKADGDADRMGAEFVKALRDIGHGEVKGYFVYGPKMASDLIEKQMRRALGCYDKMAIPLAPSCDYRVWHNDQRGGWPEPCRNPAAKAQLAGNEIVTMRCVSHPLDKLNDSYKEVDL